MARRKVLVIDDEEIIRDLLVKALDKLGYEALAAAGGGEGIEIFAENQEDIAFAIIDLLMPDMPGEETLRRLKEIQPDLITLISSGQSELEGGVSARKLGADGFLNKPYKVSQLADAIDDILGNK